MNAAHEFNLLRFAGILRRDLLLAKWELIIMLFAVTAVFTIIYSVYAFSTLLSPVNILMNSFFFCWSVLGAIQSSRSFAHVHRKGENDSYLLLPVSIMEKLAARIFSIHVIIPLSVLLMLLFAQMLSATGFAIMDVDINRSYKLFSGREILRIRNTILLNSVFMLGSIWFRRYQLLKTLLFLAALFILVFMVMAAIRNYSFALQYYNMQRIQNSSVSILLWLLIPTFWAATFFRLGRMQIISPL